MPTRNVPLRRTKSPHDQQRRVIELMRRRAPGRSPASIQSRLQELEHEIERLRRRGPGGPA